MYLKIGIAVAFGALLINFFTRTNKNTKPEHIINGVYDYIVVGGGTAGSIVASRLSEDFASSVLLLEAGGDDDETELVNVPAAFFGMQHTQYDWEYYTVPQKDACKGMVDGKSYWPRGRILGGTGNINAMQYTRGSPWDYEEWKKAGCVGWGYRDVLPYFIKSEDMQLPEFASSSFHGKGGPLVVSTRYDSEITHFFIKAGQELGYNRTDYNGYDQEGFGVVQSNTRNGVRSSTSKEYVRSARHRRNFHISLRSFVTRVDIKNDRAIGVYYVKDTKKYYVKARKEIIISGGAVNSPQLLMLSGIGPKRHLSDLGIPVVADLPVGENLQDHMTIMFHSKINKQYGIISEEILQSVWNKIQYVIFGTGPLSATGLGGSAFIHLDPQTRGTKYPDIQMVSFFVAIAANVFGYKESVAMETVPKPGGYGFTIASGLARPFSRGNIRLKNKDPFDYPLIDPKYLSDKRDLQTLISAARVWEKIMGTTPYKKLGIREDEQKFSFCSEYEFRSDAYWECYIRNLAIATYHQSCTCKMGPLDSPSTVVDTQLRVKGIKGLRVADSSVFPNVTSGNTNSPTVMVAERVADFIRGIDSVADIRKRIESLKLVVD